MSHKKSIINAVPGSYIPSVKDGWLVKKKLKRWVEVKPGWILYYEPENITEPKGVIDLSASATVESEDKGNDHYFLVHWTKGTSKTQHPFLCPDQASRDQWVVAITQCIRSSDTQKPLLIDGQVAKRISFSAPKLITYDDIPANVSTELVFAANSNASSSKSLVKRNTGPMPSKLQKDLASNDLTKVQNTMKTVDPNCVDGKAARNALQVFIAVNEDPRSLSQMNIMRYLISADVDVNHQDSLGRTPLHYACEKGWIEAINLLTARNAIVCIMDHSSRTPLHACGSNQEAKAALQTREIQIKNHFGDLEKFFSEGLSVNFRDTLGMSLIALAAKMGAIQQISLLIKKGADPHLQDIVGWGALHHACYEGRAEVVKMLIEKGSVDVNMRDYDHRTPLHIATEKKSNSCVAMLCRAGAKTDLQDYKRGFTALHYAAFNDSATCAETLLNHFADTNIRDNVGETALMIAQGKNPEVVQVILKHAAGLQLIQGATDGSIEVCFDAINRRNALVDFTDRYGRSALRHAVDHNRAEIISWLLEQKANIYLKDQKDQSPYDVAKSKNNEQILSLLTRSVVKSSLLEAADRGQAAEIERLLLVEKVDVQVTNDAGWTALHVACKKGNAACVAKLLEHGIDVNKQNADGDTALHVACQSQFSDCVRLLIQKAHDTIDVSITNTFGNTPIHVCVLSDAAECAVLVVGFSVAELRKQNASLKTPLELAEAEKQEGVIKVLLFYRLAHQLLEDARSNNARAVNNTLEQYQGSTLKRLLAFQDRHGMTALHYAAQEGFGCVAALVKAGASCLIRNNQGKTPAQIARGAQDVVEMLRLYESSVLVRKAVDKNNLSQLKEYLPAERAEKVLSFTDSFGRTALHYAVLSHNVICVAEMINRGAKVNEKDLKGLTPLYIATSTGDVDMVRTLLEHGADASLEDYDHISPVFVAMMTCFLLMMNTDLVFFENMRLKLDDYQQIFLMLFESESFGANTEAARKGKLEVLTESLDRDAYLVNYQDHGRNTLLHYAVDGGDYQTLLLLIKRGASVLVKNAQKMTPLDLAEKKGNEKAVSLLRTISRCYDLIRCANDNQLTTLSELIADNVALDFQGGIEKRTAIHVAAFNGHTEALTMLLEAAKNQADKNQAYKNLVNFSDSQGFTPLHYAVLAGKADTTRILLSHGADANAKTHAGKTPLLYASLHKEFDSEVVKLLLDYEIDVNVKDTSQRTPLYMACLNGNVEVVELLINRGAKVDEKDSHNRTCLIVAAAAGFVDICALLLKASNDLVDATDKTGTTPLLYAVRKANVRLMSLLIQYGADVNKADAATKVAPIHLAAMSSLPDALDVLLKHQATILDLPGPESKLDSQYKLRAIHIAILFGSVENVQKLVAAGADVSLKVPIKVYPLPPLLPVPPRESKKQRKARKAEAAAAAAAAKAAADATAAAATATATPPPPPVYSTLPPSSTSIIGEVIADFIPGNAAGLLTLRVGNLVKITKQGGDMWTGEMGDRSGMFPANVVSLVSTGRPVAVTQPVPAPVSPAPAPAPPAPAPPPAAVAPSSTPSKAGPPSRPPPAPVQAVDLEPKLQYKTASELMQIKHSSTNLPNMVDGASLIRAVKNADANAVQTCLQQPSDVDFVDATKSTALHYAILFKNALIVKLLLKAGASVDISNAEGVNALQVASSVNDPEITKALERADIGHQLLAAVRNSNATEVERLLSQGADATFRDAQGQTPLHFACTRDSIDVVKQFVDNRVLINSRNKRGETPIYLATKAKNKQIVELLLQRGADVQIADEAFLTPIDIARHDKSKEIVALFRELDDVDFTDDSSDDDDDDEDEDGNKKKRIKKNAVKLLRPEDRKLQEETLRKTIDLMREQVQETLEPVLVDNFDGLRKDTMETLQKDFRRVAEESRAQAASSQSSTDALKAFSQNWNDQTNKNQYEARFKEYQIKISDVNSANKDIMSDNAAPVTISL